MIKGGKGGGRTITGLHFEKRVSLKKLFGDLEDYSVDGDKLFFKNKHIATFYKKYKLYKKLLEPNNIDYSKLISKRLLPDDTLLVQKSNTLFIIEIKFQEVAGSVDEKLQTCDFKNMQYKKLMKPLGIKVKYVYVLNDWFKKKEYSDVLNYVKKMGCYYFFNELPLKFLELEKQ